MEGLVLLGIGAALGVVFGWVAFFMGLTANGRINRLEAEIARLKSAASAPPVAKPAPPQAEPQQPAPQQPEPTPRAPEASGPASTAEQAAPGPTAAAESDPAAAGHDRWRERADALASSLTGNWLIWLGGAALILGGAFLVKAAVDAGFFGPVMRVASGLAAGAAMIGWAQWMKRGGAPAHSLAPPVLAGAGGATIYGAIFAAYELYALIPPLVAFALLTAASAGLVVLAVVHRVPAMAALAIVGAHLSPVIAGSGGPAGPPFFLYIFAISAGGLAVARIMNWRPIAWLSLAGGLFWPLLIIVLDEIDSVLSLIIYLPAFFALAAAAVWDDAEQPVDVNAVLSKGPSLSLVIFCVATLGALGAGVLLTFSQGVSGPTMLMWAAFAALAVMTGRMREGLAVGPVMTAMATSVSIAFAEAAPTFPLLQIGAMFAGGYAVACYAMMRMSREGGLAALASAFGPLAVLAALFYAVGDFQQAPAWGFAAVVLAFFNISVLIELLRREEGFDASPGVAAAYGLATSLATALAVAMSLDGLAMSFGFAIQAPIIAWLWRRFRLPALRFAASALAALGAARLFFAPEIVAESVGPLPVLNLLLAAYLVPAAGFWLAARWFEGGGLSKRGAIVQGMEAAAISLFAVFVSLEIRHLMNDGDLGADYDGLVEITLQTISWVLIATFLRWRFGDDLTPVRAVAEKGLLVLAAAQTFFAAIVGLNPWWGDDPRAVGGPVLFNMLLFYYLAPAAAYGLSALAAQRYGGLIQARIAGLFAVLMTYLWLVLTVRHQFHAPDLSVGAVGNAESWQYSIVTMLFATAMLVAAALRRSHVLRYGGLAVLMLAVAKVFIFDLAALEGVWRATSFLGLGVSLVGIAVFYQRVLAPMMTDDEAPESN